MNEDILIFIKGYESQIEMYRDRVSPDCPELIEADKGISDLREAGAPFDAMWEFMGKVAEEDWMNRISALIANLASAALKQEAASGNLRIPDVATYCIAYHKSFESIVGIEKKPRTKAVYDRIFELEKSCEHTIEFIRFMAEEGLFVKMTTEHSVEVQEPLVKEALDISQLAMSHHAEEMIQMFENAKSVNEVEYEAELLTEQNRFELANEQMLIIDLYTSISEPVISYILNSSEENRQRVVAGYKFVVSYFGVDLDQLYAIPRVRHHIHYAILQAVEKNRTITEADVDKWISDEKNVVIKCLKGEVPEIGSPENAIIKIWDTNYHLNDCMEGYLNPVRSYPNIPKVI